MDDEYLDDQQYYESLPLEVLGMEACCKIFCSEYRRLVPEAEFWALAANGSFQHVFIVNNGRAFDIRGSRTIVEMAIESSQSTLAISQEQFDAYLTWGDEHLLYAIASERFRKAFEETPEKYGLA